MNKQTMTFAMVGRGTMTVQRALWQYVRCADFDLATPRLRLPDSGPPLDDAATRAEVAARLRDASGPTLLATTGEKLRHILAAARAAVDARSADDPFPLGLVDGPVPSSDARQPPTRRIDARGLVFASAFFSAEETVTLRLAEGGVAFEASRVRAFLRHLESDEPCLVVGNEPTGTDRALDVMRLRTERPYALGMTREIVAEVERIVGHTDDLRDEPLPTALRVFAEGAASGGADEYAVALRFLAEACEAHGITWAELHATRGQA